MTEYYYRWPFSDGRVGYLYAQTGGDPVGIKESMAIMIHPDGKLVLYCWDNQSLNLSLWERRAKPITKELFRMQLNMILRDPELSIMPPIKTRPLDDI